MRKFIPLLFLVLSLNVFAENHITIINTPPPIDLEVTNRVWEYVKKSTGAPKDLPPPTIIMDWEVPLIARMGTQAPTQDFPKIKLQISIAPRTVDMWPPEMIQWGIGHEMVHYAFILKENNWDTKKKIFIVKRKHHCDPEFMAITRGIADLLWDIWHVDTMRAKMYDEVIKSCGSYPDQ